LIVKPAVRPKNKYLCFRWPDRPYFSSRPYYFF